MKKVCDLANTSALDTIVRSELETQGETVADSRIFSLGSTETAKSVQGNHATQSKTAK
ncbi:hypothetical protein [Planococcus soli]|uniref:hypothetical protein n=1 Tax=Planococcus soli TaxID=2666072 RepID=UPI00163D5EDB|nr:hypothetical protein [Planococcus soli]